jgi:phosphate transport system permease protein
VAAGGVTESKVSATTRLSATSLRSSPRRRRRERVVRGAFLASSALSIVVSAGIVVALAGQALGFLTSINLSRLAAGGWFPRSNDFGIPTLVAGTMLVTVIALTVAAPIGLGAALYLSEYANRRVRRVLKPILETLAGIPSVVLGFFALAVLNPVVVRGVFGTESTFTYMAAGIAVGILIVPLVASVAEDAMFAVPDALREAAFGIGARRMTVAVRVVVPAAISGIAAALILAVSRAIGETMIVAIAAGATGGSTFTLDPLDGGQTLTGAIASLAIGSDQVRGSTQAFPSLYFVGLLLFALTLTLNVISDRFVRRVRRRY